MNQKKNKTQKLETFKFMKDHHQSLEITLHLARNLKRNSLLLSLKRTLNQNTKDIFRRKIILVSNQTSK
jgi:hypothetical protein